MKGHHAVAFTAVGGIKNHSDTIRIRFCAPDCYDVVGEHDEVHCDGKHVWIVSLTDRSWFYRDVAPDLRQMAALPGFGLVFPNAKKTVARGDAKDVVVDGKTLTEIPVANFDGAPGDYETFIRIDPATGLLAGFRSERGKEPYEDYTVRDVVLDPPLTPADFRYEPPKDFAAPPAPTVPQAPVQVQPPILGKPGAWIAVGNDAVRVGKTFAKTANGWTIDVETKSPGTFDWKATSLVGVRDKIAHKAIRVVPAPGGKRVTATFLIEKGGPALRVLEIHALAKRPTPHPVVIIVRWPGAP